MLRRAAAIRLSCVSCVELFCASEISTWRAWSAFAGEALFCRKPMSCWSSEMVFLNKSSASTTHLRAIFRARDQAVASTRSQKHTRQEALSARTRAQTTPPNTSAMTHSHDAHQDTTEQRDAIANARGPSSFSTLIASPTAATSSARSFWRSDLALHAERATDESLHKSHRNKKISRANARDKLQSCIPARPSTEARHSPSYCGCP